MEHRIELVEADEERQRYGIVHVSAYIHEVRGCAGLVRVQVWDNTGRPNPHPGETRWGEMGPIGGEGQYLDPRNKGTDEAVTVLLSPESTVVSAHGDGTGTEASGQVWAAEATPIATGDTLVLVYPDGAVTVGTVEVDHYGHGHADMKHERSHAVQLTPVPGATASYDADGNEVVDVATCGACGRSWNDAAISAVTPAPSGRCPFEYEHEDERDRNTGARFIPQRDEDTMPCVEIAGVQVYVYFEGGELRISAHYDGADAAVVAESGTVPTRVTLGGVDVYTTGWLSRPPWL